MAKDKNKKEKKEEKNTQENIEKEIVETESNIEDVNSDNNNNRKKDKKNNKRNKKGKKKDKNNKVKNPKNLILIIIMILVMVIIIIFGIFAIYSDFNTGIATKMPPYKYSGILTPYNEYVLEPSSEVLETDAYVDKDGNTVRRVPEQQVLDEEIELSTDNEENKKNQEEKPIQESPDEEVKEYTIEKREIPENPEEVFTDENYEISKNMIERYLKASNITEYTIRENKKTGKLVITVPQTKKIANMTSEPQSDNSEESMDAVNVQSILGTTGSFSVKDTITGKEYITEKNVENAKASIIDGYGVILTVKFDDEGKQILSDVSRKYVAEERDGKKYEKKATVEISGMPLLNATFGEPMDEGILQISLGQGYGKNEEVLNEIYDEAKKLENAINIGKTPIVYNVEQVNTGIESPVSSNWFKVTAITIFVFMIILALSLIFMYGLKGIYAALVLISYILVLGVIIRYTDIVITIPAIVAIVLSYVLEYVILFRYYRNIKNEDYDISDEVIDMLKYNFIILVSSIVLSFTSNVLLSSFAMVLFIAIILLFTHNYIFGSYKFYEE